MRDLLLLAVQLIVTLARLARRGGVRSVIAESLLLKQQLLISRRSRRRAPPLTTIDRFVLGFMTLFVRRDLEQVLRQDPGSAIGHALRAELLITYDWDWAGRSRKLIWASRSQTTAASRCTPLPLQQALRPCRLDWTRWIPCPLGRSNFPENS